MLETSLSIVIHRPTSLYRYTIPTVSIRTRGWAMGESWQNRGLGKGHNVEY